MTLLSNETTGFTNNSFVWRHNQIRKAASFELVTSVNATKRLKFIIHKLINRSKVGRKSFEVKILNQKRNFSNLLPNNLLTSGRVPSNARYYDLLDLLATLILPSL